MRLNPTASPFRNSEPLIRGSISIAQIQLLLGELLPEFISKRLNTELKFINDNRKSLKFAFEFLGINQIQFNNMISTESKRAFLIFQYMLFELTLETSSHNQDTKTVFHRISEVAFQRIQASLNPRNDYGHHCVGLWDLDNYLDIDPMATQPSFFLRTPKTSGVEPGFVAYPAQDVAGFLFSTFPDKEKRLVRIRKLLAEANKKRDDKENPISPYDLLATLAKNEKEHLERYLIKLTYQNDGSRDVVPDEKDLARTSTMQTLKKRFPTPVYESALKLYKTGKTRPQREVNREALLEVLANDVARAYGMEVQDQRLLINPSSQHLQFLLKGRWVENADILRPIAGDTGGHNNYLVKEVARHYGASLRYHSIPKIKNLSMFLPLFLVLADRDGIGSAGQNKLQKNGRLVGIDFGHAFPEYNPLLKSLAHDFSFHRNEFKNYSIFYDENRSEIMKGILILAKQAKIPVDENIVRSYGAEFYETWRTTIVGSDEQVFDDYINKMTDLKKAAYNKMLSTGMIETEADEKSSADFDHLIKTVKDTKQRHLESRNAVLDKFKKYILLPAHTIDLMQNIERRFAAVNGQTSMRSKDRTVMLRHLRVLKNPVKSWDIQQETTESTVLTAHFENSKAAKEALKYSETLDNSEAFSVTRNGSQLSFNITPENTNLLVTTFSEIETKHLFHSDDFELEKQLIADDEMEELLKGLSDYGIEASLEDANAADARIVFRLAEANASSIVFSFIQQALAFCNCSLTYDNSNTIQVNLNHKQVSKLRNFLIAFHKNFPLLRQEWQRINDRLLIMPHAHMQALPKMYFDGSQFSFRLHIRDNSPTPFPAQKVNNSLSLEEQVDEFLIELEDSEAQNDKENLSSIIKKILPLLKQDKQQTQNRYRTWKITDKIKMINANFLHEYLSCWLESPERFDERQIDYLAERLSDRHDYLENCRPHCDEIGILAAALENIKSLNKTIPTQIQSPTSPRIAS